MFRFLFGSGQKDSKKSSEGTTFYSPSPPPLDMAALKQTERERSRQTYEALTRGELPPNVIERIREQSAGDLPWTSDLSINEWAALRQYRLKPLGQVMGSAFYHVGYIPNTFGGFFPSSHEMQAPTQALYKGRQLAMTRMQQEAAALGANAVVGVHLENKGFHFEKGVVEYVAYGTAILVEGLSPTKAPVLCTVSGQDFARLLAAGTLPVGLALGASFYYLRTDYWDLQQQRSWYNQEMQHFQRGVREVRRLAAGRLREDAMRLGGSGIIGAGFHVRVEEVPGGTTNDDQEITDHILEAVTIGTVVEHVDSGANVRLQVQSVVDLRS